VLVTEGLKRMSAIDATRCGLISEGLKYKSIIDGLRRVSVIEGLRRVSVIKGVPCVLIVVFTID
jgi:hypothetical protein